MNLVVHQGALGDFVLTFPVLRGLSGPTLVASAASKSRLAARLFPHVRAVDADSPRWSRLYAGNADVELPPAELVISFVSSGHDAWADNIRRLLPRARPVFVHPRPPAGWSRHVTQWHADQLHGQGVSLEPGHIAPRDNPDGPVVIHPGSGGPRKCWPIARFLELADSLRNDGRRIVFIVGEVERETWPSSALASLDAQVVETLDALSDWLMAARLHVGNDSGPTHLAAQLGVPTIALFGPTAPGVWEPRGPRVHLLAPPEPTDMTWLPVSAVLDACRAAQRPREQRHGEEGQQGAHRQCDGGPLPYP